MPVLSWKPKFIPISFFEAALIQKKENVQKKKRKRIFLSKSTEIYRRNFIPTSTLVNALRGNVLSVYNGYDFFEKTIYKNMPMCNFGASVITRETKVVHKVKLTKQARKNLQQKNIKKNSQTTGKKNTNSKAKKKTNSKAKKK